MGAEFRDGVRSARRGVGLLLVAAALTVVLGVILVLNWLLARPGSPDGAPSPAPFVLVQPFVLVHASALSADATYASPPGTGAAPFPSGGLSGGTSGGASSGPSSVVLVA